MTGHTYIGGVRTKVGDRWYVGKSLMEIDWIKVEKSGATKISLCDVDGRLGGFWDTPRGMTLRCQSGQMRKAT